MPTADGDIFERLAFPPIWVEAFLYPDQLREVQERELVRKPPGQVCGSEHFRYAAFCHWLSDSKTPEAKLRQLVTAAAVDPDPVMAQAALIDVAAHPNCTEALFHDAHSAFLHFAEQYFDEEQLLRAHREGLPSWKLW